MDKTRAALVTSAGVGLLISAIVLHTWGRKRRRENDSDHSVKAVVYSEDGNSKHPRNHAIDAV